MITGAFIYPAILVMIGVAPTFWTLAAALVFLGMCGNLLNISMNTQAIVYSLCMEKQLSLLFMVYGALLVLPALWWVP
jgi:hypothetical protein